MKEKNQHSTLGGQFFRGRSEQGFTLTELLVVILVIGLLLAIALPTFLGQQDKAKDTDAKVLLDTAYKTAKTSSVDNNGLYPSEFVISNQLWINENIDSASTPEVGKITVVETGGHDLRLETLSASEKVCSLEADLNSRVVECVPASAVPPGGPVVANSPTTQGAIDTRIVAGSVVERNLAFSTPKFEWEEEPTSVAYSYEVSNNGSTWSTSHTFTAPVAGANVGIVFASDTLGTNFPQQARLKAVATDASSRTTTAYSTPVVIADIQNPVPSSNFGTIYRASYNAVLSTMALRYYSLQWSRAPQEVNYFYDYSTDGGSNWTAMTSPVNNPTAGALITPTTNVFPRRNNLVRVRALAHTNNGGTTTIYSAPFTPMSAPSGP